MTDKPDDSPAAIVVGSGPAGLTAAIALAQGGVSTVIVGRQPTRPDHRTTALLASSVTALKTLGVWQSCAAQAAPLKVMRIVDDTGRLWRAPEVKFSATEIDLDAFGYNIENRHLIVALKQRVGALPKLRLVEDAVARVTSDGNGATILLGSDRTLQTQLIVGADGRNSMCRKAAGIAMDERNYPQVALAICLRHSRPHHNTSTEFHTPSGPFTLIPLPGNRSSLVWVLDPAEADELAACDDVELAGKIERASHSILGTIEIESGRGLYPLSVATARRFAGNRVVLVGEAAHVMPPIGAQGLNLGLRDAATVGELAIAAHRDGHDAGGPDVVTNYDKKRRADIGSRTFVIDLFNRSLLSDFLPVQALRGLGLYLVDRIGPLRRAVMREGVLPAVAQPRLMRGEAL
jgi:2-octaprenyl-6-methoxyphenol hydroxylase